jgi:hypothetical protein
VIEYLDTPTGPILIHTDDAGRVHAARGGEFQLQLSL